MAKLTDNIKNDVRQLFLENKNIPDIININTFCFKHAFLQKTSILKCKSCLK